jgi:3'-phosphoadenosine 5'-phosphosulfate sulfotransferase (PAPS reductase)/FAD synthetase
MSLLPWPTVDARHVDALLSSAFAVIDDAYAGGAQTMAPLFSGGHDSLCATYIASQHSSFVGDVHHINTGIGSAVTRTFVEDVARDYGWRLLVHRSPATYERFVSRLGFPGPGSHQWVYNWLKDRCVSAIVRERGRTALITGCREQESTRRMGTVQRIQVGETSRKTGKTTKRKRIWAAPCFDWSSEEQRAFMEWHDLPRNPIKDSPLGMSGECFCGAFARPDEIAMIRRYAPDVALEIARLSVVAEAHGTHAAWGTRPDRARGLVVAASGQLCSSCDRRAAVAGLLFE